MAFELASDCFNDLGPANGRPPMCQPSVCSSSIKTQTTSRKASDPSNLTITSVSALAIACFSSVLKTPSTSLTLTKGMLGFLSLLVADIDDDLSHVFLLFDDMVSFRDRFKIEMTRINLRDDVASGNEPGCLTQDLAMVCPTLAGKQWQQRENAGIGGSSERKRSQRMGTPAEATHDVAETTHSEE